MHAYSDPGKRIIVTQWNLHVSGQAYDTTEGLE